MIIAAAAGPACERLRRLSRSCANASPSAKIVGFDGAYHRFMGKVTIEKFEKDVRVEIVDDDAIWGQMYFGKVRSLKASKRNQS
jgi:hypothetical protein